MHFNTPYNPMKISFYFKYSQTKTKKSAGYGSIYYYLMMGNGQSWIIKPRVKRIEENNQIQIIPLSETALQIIQKYGSIEQMPHTKQTTINRYIKQACVKAGITMTVSSKLGRSSGISFKYNFGGMREHSIAAIVGWTYPRELVNYLEIDMVQLHNEFLGERA
ncbi:hypothetical protein VB796_05965 [Arcicella sp. LKC2W]|uniref:hypothetical protein n=1 Tax=Arcicella sp. LKC2W TaxID=2984198 RepID=UPI002B20A18B|nr:hypothetical protein [Arcicella sp. LKC2W]MEA5458573.1 hypothetical protein [Arcicella sp. LKC2W]